jgi:uncharacterized protein (DUF2235 family)
MKRIIILIDGTWNKKGVGADTNVAKLDCGKRLADFIKSKSDDETKQRVHYHDGVGADGDLIQRLRYQWTQYRRKRRSTAVDRRRSIGQRRFHAHTCVRRESLGPLPGR